MDNQDPNTNPPAAPAAADPNAALLAELTQLKTWRAEREVEDARRQQEQRLAEQRKLIEQGEIEKLVKKHAEDLELERRRAAEVASRHKASEKSRELTLALAGHNLVKGAAQQLTKLWDAEFEVVDHGEGFAVRSRDLKSPADWVKERLASEEYAHFVRAERQGGGGSQGGQARQPTPTPGTAAPVNFAADLAARIQQQQTAGGFSAGMGLRAIK